MFEALKRADVKAADIQTLMENLLAEHNMPGVRAQLKTLWIEHAHELFHKDEEPGPGSAEPRSRAGGGVRAKAATPPASPPRSPPGAAGERGT